LKWKFPILFNLGNDESDEDDYRPLKRFLLHKPTTTSTEQIPSVIDNLINPLATNSKI
jgi:hypothetical protein